MKRNRIILNRFVAFGMAATMASGMLPAPVLAQGTRSAKIYSTTGTISVKRGGDKLLSAFEGMRLEEGDIIISSVSSSAVIEIDADKTVNVDENTEIALSTLAGTAEESQTGISVFFGNIVSSIQNKLSKNSTFEAETPTAIMGVRGTTFLVGQPMEKSPSVVVSSGKVQTDTVNGGGALVEPGFVYEADAEAPEPVSLDTLTEYGPVAVSALANDTLVEALKRGGTDIDTGGLISAATQRREQQRQEAAKSQPPAPTGQQDTQAEYFLDTGATIAAAAGAPVPAADSAKAEEASTAPAVPEVSASAPEAPKTPDLPAQEPAPAEGVQQTGISPESAIAPLVNTTAGTLAESKTAAAAPAGNSSGGAAQKNTDAAAPPSVNTPSSPDAGQSNGSNSNGGSSSGGGSNSDGDSNSGGGSNSGGNDNDHTDELPDPPSPRPQMPTVTGLSAVTVDDGDGEWIKVLWNAVTGFPEEAVEYVITFDDDKHPYPLRIENNDGVCSFLIPVEVAKQLTSVTVETRNKDIAYRASDPVTYAFRWEDQKTLDEIDDFKVDWLEGNGSIQLSWKRHSKSGRPGFVYHVVLLNDQGSKKECGDISTNMGNNKVEATLSSDNLVGYTSVGVYVTCPRYEASDIVTLRIPEATPDGSIDNGDHDVTPPDNSSGDDPSDDSSGDDSSGNDPTPDEPSYDLNDLEPHKSYKGDNLIISWDKRFGKFSIILMKGTNQSPWSDSGIKELGEKYYISIPIDEGYDSIIFFNTQVGSSMKDFSFDEISE